MRGQRSQRDRSAGWARTGLGVVCLALVGGCAESDPPLLVAATGSSELIHGFDMALEDRRAAGGFPDIDTVSIAEGSSRAGPALEIAQDLVQRPGLAAVIGHANSAASLAAAPVYNQSRVVQIAPTTSAVTYSQAGPYSFRMVPPDDRQGRFLAEAVRQVVPDARRIALLWVNDDYGRGLREAVMAALPADVEVVVDLPHAEEAMTEADYGTASDAVTAAGPDLVLWLARPRILERLLAHAPEALSDVPVVGGDAVSSAVAYPDSTGRWANVRYVQLVDPQATPALRAFAERYRQRFGTPVSTLEILSYEAASLVFAAIGDGARTGDEIRLWLDGLGAERPPFEALSGPVRFDSLGNVDRSYSLAPVRSMPPR